MSHGRMSTNQSFFASEELSHALMLLLAWMEHLDAAVVMDKDKLLRDQFLENLADPQLRRDIKC